VLLSDEMSACVFLHNDVLVKENKGASEGPLGSWRSIRPLVLVLDQVLDSGWKGDLLTRC